MNTKTEIELIKQNENNERRFSEELLNLEEDRTVLANQKQVPLHFVCQQRVEASLQKIEIREQNKINADNKI